MTEKRPLRFDREKIFASGSKVHASWPCALKLGCSHCDGLGYRVATEGAFAKAEVCSCVRECPACFGQARQVIGNDAVPCRKPSPASVVNHFNVAEIPGRYAQASLENFKNDTGNGRQIVEKLKVWREKFHPTGSKGIVISGPVGVGKTYIMAALAKYFAEKGMSVRFTDFFQLLGDLRSGFSEGKADSSQLAPLIEVDVLVIDEMGKGRGKDFEKTILDQLICGRYNQSKTIIASTNYSLSAAKVSQSYNVPLDATVRSTGDFDPDQFGPLEERIGARMYSRMREMTHFIDLQGEDVRRLDV